MKKLHYEYDYSLLKGRIVYKYGTLGEFAHDVLKITPTAFSRILQNQSKFSQDSIILIVQKLEIAVEDIPAYFFNVKSQKGANDD